MPKILSKISNEICPKCKQPKVELERIIDELPDTPSGRFTYVCGNKDCLWSINIKEIDGWKRTDEITKIISQKKYGR